MYRREAGTEVAKPTLPEPSLRVFLVPGHPVERVFWCPREPRPPRGCRDRGGCGSGGCDPGILVHFGRFLGPSGRPEWPKSRPKVRKSAP